MKYFINNRKGFTLIELLVVIAIIGILSSVVLASLSTARSKGADAKIKSQLASMRPQAELYTGAGNPYTASTCSLVPATIDTTLFDSDEGGLAGLMNGLVLANTRCASGTGKPSNGTPWAVAALLSTGAWCVDSTGVSRGTVGGGATPYGALTTAIAVGGTSCL
jgi:prepilin-type N-terminal cleavage/methylation domain-containing protein